MDFGSFENTIDKNVETDKTSGKFDQQLQAYKDAGNSLTSAKSGLEMATASMHEAKDKLSEASDKANTVTKAIEAYILHLLYSHSLSSERQFVGSCQTMPLFGRAY